MNSFKHDWADLWKDLPMPKFDWLHTYRLIIGIRKIQQFMKPYHCYPFESFALWHIGNEIYFDSNDHENTGIHHLTMQQLLIVITSIHNLNAKPEVCRPCQNKLILPL